MKFLGKEVLNNGLVPLFYLLQTEFVTYNEKQMKLDIWSEYKSHKVGKENGLFMFRMIN